MRLDRPTRPPVLVTPVLAALGHAWRLEVVERLHEGSAGTRERVEHVRSGLEAPVEQHLDELRDERAVVGTEPVDVLRPLPLRQCALRPRELEVQRRVQLVLCDGHASDSTAPVPLLAYQPDVPQSGPGTASGSDTLNPDPFASTAKQPVRPIRSIVRTIRQR